ncbi:MAG TPA: hypothetical protein VGY32_08365 [Solirubrobacteraceae bacterium]|nr:hypothetical protein [Solirubrobacteraceae bacterium]
MRAQTLTREREQPPGRFGIDALGERWRWATPSRLTWIAFGFMLAGGAAFLLHLTRGTTLWFDDWLWALYRRSGTHSLLTPYNDHFSLVPILIYRLLFATQGIGSYVPYRVLITVGHLLCVTLLFVYARRRVGDYLALVAAALLLFLGPGWQNILWPFQIAWVLSVAAGIAALLALDRRDLPGDGAACLLLAISLACSSVGVAVAAGLVVAIAWERRNWRNAWIVALPIGLYIVWSLAYQDASLRSNGIFDIPLWAARSAAGAVSSLLGLSGQTTSDQQGTILEFGVPLALVGLVGALLVAFRRGLRPRVAALVTMALAFWALTAAGRSFIGGTPFASRYLYVDAAFVLLVAVEVAQGVRLGRPALVLVGVAGVAAVVSNLGVLREAGGYLRSQAPVARADLGALEIGRTHLQPGYVANQFPGYPFVVVRAGAYFAMKRSIGSPAYSASQLPAAPEPALEVADGELIRVYRLALTPGPAAAVGLGSPPRIDAVTGATVVPRGRCVAYRPAPITTTSESVTITLPPSGVSLRGTAPITVSVRRFGQLFHPVATLQGGASARLSVPADQAATPWHVQVQSLGPAVMCGA